MRWLLLAAVLVAAIGCDKDKRAAEDKRRANEEALWAKGDGGGGEAGIATEVTAQELVEAYRTNVVAADAKFKDKTLRVKNAEVEHIGRSRDGAYPAVASKWYPGDHVGNRQEYTRLLFAFRDKDDPAPGKLKPGHPAVFEGTCRGKMSDRPDLRDDFSAAHWWYIGFARATIITP